ncbi:hypothetical protein [Kitasatospora sp. NPDC001527]|uniref:hypothetical protein n=1 Tax=Kitasatospora sp. NPDC001527 TaxID=3154519 RepID=UPI003324887D
MTTLDQTAADPPPSAPPAAPPAPSVPAPAPAREDGAAQASGSAGTAAGGAAGAVPPGGAPRCSIAAAVADGRTGGTAGVLPGGSVPQPRGGGAGDRTGAALGRPGDGAAPERTDGTDGAGGGGGGEGFVRLQQPPAAQDRTVPVLRAAREELRTLATRRPAPSRRLRRMHPQAAGPLRPDTARTGPGTAADVPSVPGPRTDDDRTGAAARPATGTEAPLGVLIGATPHLPEAAGRPGPAGTATRPEERPAIRATAELVRLGRGTCLVVLPAWRPAIAVSVPTELLLGATGLAYERLAGAQLSVVINPGALHDRELEPRDWRAGPPGRTGRRGGRRTV